MSTTSNTEYLERDCPLCGTSRRAAKPTVIADRPAELEPMSAIRDNWEKLQSGIFFSYARCAVCGLLYCPIYLTPDQTAELYASMQDNSWGAEEEPLGRTQTGYLNLLRVVAPIQGMYLEFGPDTGLLARAAVESGSLSRLALIEPNKAVHEELSRNVGEMGMIYTSLREVTPDEKFDCIVAIHVLDHLAHLNELMIELSNRAKPGGGLLAVVHDEHSALRYLLRKKWHPFWMQHPQLFNKHTLSACFSSAGFINPTIKKTTNYVHSTRLAREGSAVLGLKPGLDERVPDFPLPVRLGNIGAAGRRVD